MSDVSITDLIAEARRASVAIYVVADEPVADDISRILRQLADALESVTAPTEKELDNAAFDYVDDQRTVYTERGDFYERGQMEDSFIAGFHRGVNAKERAKEPTQ